MKKFQLGVGLMEVLVALILLAIGVLGFSVLQFRAMEAANEATERTSAINISRDLAERMRLNRLGLADYKTGINEKKKGDDCLASDSTSYTPNCTSQKMAYYDATEILAKAEESGQTIVIADCVSSELNCIYVSWGETQITGSNLSSCVDGTTGTYVSGSKCQLMEAF